MSSGYGAELKLRRWRVQVPFGPPAGVLVKATLVNRKLAHLLPVGIFNHVMLIEIVFVSLCVSIGPENPHWGIGQLGYLFVRMSELTIHAEFSNFFYI